MSRLMKMIVSNYFGLAAFACFALAVALPNKSVEATAEEIAAESIAEASSSVAQNVAANLAVRLDAEQNLETVLDTLETFCTNCPTQERCRRALSAARQASSDVYDSFTNTPQDTATAPPPGN